MTQPWTLHDDRALPADPVTRPIAREIYQEIRDLPIVSMHGHVPVEWFADDTPFPDPAALLVTPDHYLMRMLVSQGAATLAQLGVAPLDGSGTAEADPRAIWRRFCENWKAFRGTPTRFWMEHELVTIFGVTHRPSAQTADVIYDQIAAEIAKADFRPRALLDRFNIEVIGTTDPAWASLEHHQALAAEGFGERILPTFRPDPVLHLDNPTFTRDVLATGAAAGVDVVDYATYLDALRAQRLRFKAAGGTATDHGHSTADTTPLPDDEAARLFTAAFTGKPVSAAEVSAFAAHMLFQMAAMATEDGLVMQIHPGVERGHSREMTARYGADKGYDIPFAVEYTRALRPMLEAFGHHPNFRTIVFTLDEDVYSRELAPLAGVYPAMRLGAPWWFIDSPEAMRRFRETATETAGFLNLSGFVDDTRAFCSIPARHDLARRIDAGYLARLVAEHRLDLDEAIDTAHDLTYRLPRLAYAAR
ncbi:Glucuronate isomerase [Xylanimonas cellulosilytica DSM 15894]|uniref:Uronate isomerase n=1 Tax=Xylanimonas cellulosilytica (strain DSM 15894 / JCM 12276 / CECT 5975 / KCTC 9989 / LMG 20990 / NBRC 107835 / XIL07) TaxID=446471 RepID=D1BX96_XYLCX|nr:glucuronate isomerase [Xylanimonas cellulosilytica]ACZ31664.1 Glucuronate isomerase [Xylanimonas cellulosilytica DSM 15894]